MAVPRKNDSVTEMQNPEIAKFEHRNIAMLEYSDVERFLLYSALVPAMHIVIVSSH
jgi:hypothetical protein